MKNQITSELLKELYWKKGLTLSEIAKKFKKGIATIHRYMKKFGIPRRKRGYLEKYKKVSFSGDLNEKAYLIGIRFGDVSALRHRRQIQVQVTTTHPAMVKLFNQLFRRYGHVAKCPIYNKKTQKYEWVIYSLLNNSFRFLLKKSKIPDWILNNDAYFLSFLSGYFDAEGCIYFRKESWSSNKTGLSMFLATEDAETLNKIRDKLIEIGYHPTLKLLKIKGSPATHGQYNEDFWVLYIYRKKEIVDLLSKLKLRHSEKIRKCKLLYVAKDKPWSSVVRDVLKLRQKIKTEVNLCKYKAFKEYAERHKAKNKDILKNKISL